MPTPMRAVVWLQRKGLPSGILSVHPRAEGDWHHPVPHMQDTAPGMAIHQHPHFSRGNTARHVPAVWYSCLLGNPFWENALLHFCYWDSNQGCAWKHWDFIFTFLSSFLLFSRQEFGSEQAHPLLQTGTANEITSSPSQNNLVEHRLIHLSEVTCWLLPKIACKGLKNAAGTLVPNTPEAPRGCPGPAALGLAPLSPCRQGWAVPLFHPVSPVAKHTPHGIYTAGIPTVFIHRWTKQTDPPFSIKSSF